MAWCEGALLLNSPKKVSFIIDISLNITNTKSITGTGNLNYSCVWSSTLRNNLFFSKKLPLSFNILWSQLIKRIVSEERVLWPYVPVRSQHETGGLPAYYASAIYLELFGWNSKYWEPYMQRKGVKLTSFNRIYAP